MSVPYSILYRYRSFSPQKQEDLNPLIKKKVINLAPILVINFVMRLFSSHLKRDISSQKLQGKLHLHTHGNTMLLGKVGVNLTLGIAGAIGLEGAFWFIKLVLCC